MIPTVLFANPSAQSGGAGPLIERAKALLEQAQVPHRFVATVPDGGTVELVREAIERDGARRVIYMGGDGTFAEVAKGILTSAHGDEVAMGMLPTGTANDQGKSLGLVTGPEALADNVRVIAGGETTRMDVGRIERLDEADRVTHSDLFFDSASVGFGAAVLRTRNQDREAVERVPLIREIYQHQLVYAGAVLKQMLESIVSVDRFELEAEIDGQTTRYSSLIDVIIKNTCVFGGEWELTPGARHDDGLFEVVPVAGHRDLTSKLIATHREVPFTEADLREIGLEHSTPVCGSQIVLTIYQPGAERSQPAQIDGEEFPSGDKFRVEVLPRALRLITV